MNMNVGKIENLSGYDSDNAIYWRRKYGRELIMNDDLSDEVERLMCKVAELETEIGILNKLGNESGKKTDKKPYTCE